MANDFLLLQRYPEPTVPRFRHYGWRAPAFTFGYGQKIAFVRDQLPPDETFDLCRRPTGGGIVDHRDDWTYALVIPRGHALEELRATFSYRAVHEALAAALQIQGVPAGSSPLPTQPKRPGGRVLRARRNLRRGGRTHGNENRRRRAEAEQARAAVPGSIARSGDRGDRRSTGMSFEQKFTAQLAIALGDEARQCPGPSSTRRRSAG